MGLWRVIWTGCCGMCCLIPMAWLSFTFLDLTAAVSNGIFIDLGPALNTILSSFLPGVLGSLIPIVVGGLLGIVMLLFFPLHWALYYRPDDVVMALAIIVPWILMGTITSALFCKKAKQGFDTGLAVGLGYAIAITIPVLALDAFVGGIGFSITDILNGVFTGLTDLPFYGALFLSCIEGGLIGGIFGALIGALKYKPEGETVKGKKSKKSKMSASTAVFDSEPSIGSGSGNNCKHCGSALGKGDTFCPSCGKSS